MQRKSTDDETETIHKTLKSVYLSIDKNFRGAIVVTCIFNRIIFYHGFATLLLKTLLLNYETIQSSRMGILLKKREIYQRVTKLPTK